MPTDTDPLAAIYSGAKAPLRALHETLIAEIDKLGPCEKSPKKTYVSLRRKKQFAMVGPATCELVELGLNVKQLHATGRLKAQPPGTMCQYTAQFRRVERSAVGAQWGGSRTGSRRARRRAHSWRRRRCDGGSDNPVA